MSIAGSIPDTAEFDKLTPQEEITALKNEIESLKQSVLEGFKRIETCISSVKTNGKKAWVLLR